MRRFDPPKLTVAVPVLNEERYIADCLGSLMAQEGVKPFEIIVADGGSTDRTREIVAALSAQHPNIRLIANPRRLQSAAINLAATEVAKGTNILVRADAHALYPRDFLRKCLDALLASGAQSVVVPMRTVGARGFQRAIAAAQNSRLGNGGSSHRVAGMSGFVDHGHHAMFDLTFFRQIGGYNETFSHNEDAEFDIRLHRFGGRVWLCTEAPVAYFPRSNLRGLARQYYRHGAGRARTLLTHNIRPRLRQMLPVAALAGVVAGALLWPLSPIFALIPLLYVAICLIWAACAVVRARDPGLIGMAAAAITMHLAWAVGFLKSVMQHQASSRP
ncbi:glycosyltransferase family 2 protein [Methylovirgula sp. 4M-Z18]|uniref:glycosyltransferase family 2 protein n=1 Tax=Methylovirgula sp. 4M-Z18 TaxID=2293567 RepID=UPI001314C24B|nr:glycosyltransferase family 2 protein [Methylovirgula sp. 4M-Z18]